MAPSTANIAERALPGSSDGSANLGSGQVNGSAFANAGFLALFAILAAGMVLAAIYFFFIAKNGGFKKITKNDWEDYKSTVLRRKGPDGKTLSNATKSTRLGGGSVVPKWARSEYSGETESSYKDGGRDVNEMREVEEGRGGRERKQQGRHTSRHDPELAAYKTEKAAKVGGLNTSLHGSQWDHTNTDRSDVTPAPPTISKKEAKKMEKERAAREKAERKEAQRLAKESKKDQAPSSKKQQKEARRSQPSAAYSFNQGDDASTSVYTASNERRTEYTAQPSIRQVSHASYYDSYRPNHNLTPVREQPTPASSHHSGGDNNGRRSHRASRESITHTQQQRERRENSSSPRKQHRPNPSRSDYTVSSSGDTGTKVYEHHIPGISNREIGVDDSVSQAGARRAYRASQQHASFSAAAQGFRRGGGGGRSRGDELSEDEDVGRHF